MFVASNHPGKIHSLRGSINVFIDSEGIYVENNATLIWEGWFIFPENLPIKIFVFRWGTINESKHNKINFLYKSIF